MTSITFLHFSDLHVGCPEADRMWDLQKGYLFEDLKYQHDRSGPWDLLLISGDLVWTGASEEYAQLTDTLEMVREELKSMGSDPLLLAVPGNRDLTPWEDFTNMANLSQLGGYFLNLAHSQELLDAEFWTENDACRNYCATCFGNFQTWFDAWNRTQNPRTLFHDTGKIDYQRGILPGDFSASLQKGNLRIGLIGLNDAFRQLGSTIEGRLELAPNQFASVCDNDPREWLRTHHTNILVTHHGPAWLLPQSQNQLKFEMRPADLFSAHLFGHLHEGQYSSSCMNRVADLLEI